jgi:hypothetical protein
MKQLGLARAPTVYTRDGTTVFTLRELVLWALDESCIQRESEEQKKDINPVATEEIATESMEGWL